MKQLTGLDTSFLTLEIMIDDIYALADDLGLKRKLRGTSTGC